MKVIVHRSYCYQKKKKRKKKRSYRMSHASDMSVRFICRTML